MGATLGARLGRNSLSSLDGQPLRLRARLRRRLATEGTLALGAYVSVSVLYFGRFPLLAGRAGTLGVGPDVQIFIWGLRWWPYALLHGLNPFVSHVVWQPYGSDVLWSTTVPGLSLVAAPVTLTLGPIAAWNLLCVLAPALTAWASFLLCRELTGRRWPSLIAGLTFGFSSYELAAGQAHLQLTMSLCVPLVAWVVVRHLKGLLTTRQLAIRLSALLAVQFLISPEVLATMLLIGTLVLAAAIALVPEVRQARKPLLRGLAAGVAGAGAIVAPLVVAMLRYAPTHLNAVIGYSADLLNLIIPTRVTALGGAWSSGITTGFPGNLSEQGAYLGLPLCLILVAFTVTHWRDARGRLLAVALVISVVLSLGSHLTIGGQRLFWLPGALMTGVPLLKDVLPARLTLFTALTASCMVALWLAQPRAHRRLAWITACAAALALVPATGARRWWRPVPAAISDGALARLIPPHSNVISLPFWNVTDRALLLQSNVDMRFNLADVWLQTMPGRYQGRFRGAHALSDWTLSRVAGPSRTDELEDALCFMHVNYVIVWRYGSRMLAGLDLRPRRAGETLVYKLPPCSAAAAPTVRARAPERRSA